MKHFNKITALLVSASALLVGVHVLRNDGVKQTKDSRAKTFSNSLTDLLRSTKKNGPSKGPGSSIPANAAPLNNESSSVNYPPLRKHTTTFQPLY